MSDSGDALFVTRAGPKGDFARTPDAVLRAREVRAAGLATWVDPGTSRRIIHWAITFGSLI